MSKPKPTPGYVPHLLHQEAFNARLDALGRNESRPEVHQLIASAKAAYAGGRDLDLHQHGIHAYHHGMGTGLIDALHDGRDELRTTLPLPPVSNEARSNLMGWERQWVEHATPHEEGVAIGHDGQTHIHATSHSPHHIELGPYMSVMQSIPHGGIFTHNHPATSAGFSGEDLALAHSLGLREMRVVTPRHLYSVAPGHRGSRFTPRGWHQLKPQYEAIASEVYRHLKPLHEAGQVTSDQANELFAHRTLQHLADESGLDYRVDGHPWRPKGGTP